MASAATGNPLLLGKSNSANKPTILTNTGTGAALDLRPKAGQPALKTNSNKLIPNLNADMVDGKSSAAFATAGSSYTKAESDGKYALTAAAYTRAQSDAKYALTAAAYTKAQSDAKYALTGASYTKAQSDANYPATASVYTKTAADARFPRILEGGTASATSNNNTDFHTLFDGAATVPGPGLILVYAEGKYTAGSSMTFLIHIDDPANPRVQAGTNTTGSFASTGHYVAAAGTYDVDIIMRSADASPSTGTVWYTVLFVPIP